MTSLYSTMAKSGRYRLNCSGNMHGICSKDYFWRYVSDHRIWILLTRCCTEPLGNDLDFSFDRLAYVLYFYKHATFLSLTIDAKYFLIEIFWDLAPEE